MSEEEIIKNIKEMIQWSDHNTYKMALQGLLDLYKQEKEKNIELQNYMKEYLIPKSTINLLYISKDKIREALDDGILDAKGWGEEGGADIVAQKILILLEEE